MRLHKTEYSTYSNEELIKLAEAYNRVIPPILALELLERVKEILDEQNNKA